MHRHADLRRHITVAAEGHDAGDKIGRLARKRKRRPAQLRRRRLASLKGALRISRFSMRA